MKSVLVVGYMHAFSNIIVCRFVYREYPKIGNYHTLPACVILHMYRLTKGSFLFLGFTCIAFTRCIIHSMYHSLDVSFTRCIIHSMYPSRDISFTRCIIHSMLGSTKFHYFKILSPASSYIIIPPGGIIMYGLAGGTILK